MNNTKKQLGVGDSDTSPNHYNNNDQNLFQRKLREKKGIYFDLSVASTFKTDEDMLKLSKI